MAGLLDFLRQNSPTSGLGQLSEAEIAQLKFEQMKAQIDEMSRMRQMSELYGMGQVSDNEGNTMLNAIQRMNPQANTMQNIPPSVGGLSARNAQPNMNLNTLLKMLGY